MQVAIPYGKRIFLPEIECSERKRISIIVRPDLSIIIKAPKGTTLISIKLFLQKKTTWIAKQVEYFERFHPLPVERCYISGESHLYLGKYYRLKVKTGNTISVKLQGQFLVVETPITNREKLVKKLIEEWYRKHATEYLKKRVDEILPAFLKQGVKTPKIRIQMMKRRWGSCSKNKNIILNTDLIKAPISGIDYVITHELCHLLSSKHDSRFYRYLSMFMPDWEKRKARLERVLI